MNHKKLYRLYTEERLGVRRRRGRKRARGSRTPMPVALRPDERWSLDFVSDTFGASRKFRMLAVNDHCCRENLCLRGFVARACAARRRSGVVRQGPVLEARVGQCVVNANVFDLQNHRKIPHERIRSQKHASSAAKCDDRN